MALPPYVAPNELIMSAWGNGVVDELARLDDEKLDRGMGPFAVRYGPGSNTGAPTAATMATWLTLPVVDVPAGAGLVAVLNVHITNISRVAETASCIYAVTATLSGGSYSNDSAVVDFNSINNLRLPTSFSLEFPSPGAGARSVLIGARRASGTGQIQVGTTSVITATVQFRQP